MFLSKKHAKGFASFYIDFLICFLIEVPNCCGLRTEIQLPSIGNLLVSFIIKWENLEEAGTGLRVYNIRKHPYSR